MGMKNPGGEIVQVQGGHIVRSTGRKDRHSKVFTAKGPRDRRVRLSAHTAIQFYDVQDRLGYDRPSKAVDWLIKKAKSAIDKLAELPPWQPTDTAAGETPDAEPNPNMAGSGEMEAGIDPESSGYGFQALQRAQQLGGAGEASAEGYSIPESMKPFFPTSSENHQSSLNFQNYAQENPAATAADHLGLSLHSFHGGGADNAPQAEQALFGFGSGNYQRIVAWQGHGHDGGGGEGRGFGFNNAASFSAAAQTQPQGLLGHHPATSLFNSTNQRGTLQSSSSFSQLVRAWDDLPSMAAASSSHRPQQQQQQQIHQPSIFGTRFVTDGGGGFPVFRIPARIHGEDSDQHDGEGGHSVVSKRPSSSSSPNSAHH